MSHTHAHHTFRTFCVFTTPHPSYNMKPSLHFYRNALSTTRQTVIKWHFLFNESRCLLKWHIFVLFHWWLVRATCVVVLAGGGEAVGVHGSYRATTVHSTNVGGGEPYHKDFNESCAVTVWLTYGLLYSSYMDCRKGPVWLPYEPPEWNHSLLDI